MLRLGLRLSLSVASFICFECGIARLGACALGVLSNRTSVTRGDGRTPGGRVGWDGGGGHHARSGGQGVPGVVLHRQEQQDSTWPAGRACTHELPPAAFGSWPVLGEICAPGQASVPECFHSQPSVRP